MFFGQGSRFTKSDLFFQSLRNTKYHQWFPTWFSWKNATRHVANALRVLQPYHDDVIKWEHFPRYWPFVREVHRLPVNSPYKGQWRRALMFSLICHRSPVNSPYKGQWRRALMFSVICAWIKCWVNNREAGDLRRHRAHYDVIVIWRVSVIFSPSRTIRWVLILLTWINLYPSMGVSNYIHYKVWDEITYPFTNFNGCKMDKQMHDDTIYNATKTWSGPWHEIGRRVRHNGKPTNRTPVRRY